MPKKTSGGKEKDHMTYAEKNHMHPPAIVPTDQLNDVIMMSGEMETDDVDTIQKAKIAEEEVEIREKEENGVDSTLEGAEDFLPKTNNPIKLYLREMGSVSLLTREGEIEIAKRIEKGIKKVSDVILNSRITVREVILLGEKLKKGKINVRDIVQDLEHVDFYLVEDIYLKHVLELIDNIKELDNENRSLRDPLKRWPDRTDRPEIEVLWTEHRKG
jgi:RNA polymerase primary sigma factor